MSHGIHSPSLGKPERRTARSGARGWQTGITHVEPNRILVRGYPLDELMGRVSFAQAVYLLLVGELPTPSIGRMMEALLVSSIDHGPVPPSTNAARLVASSGAPLRASVAAGVLAFGEHHGGDVGSCMDFLARGVGLVREGHSYDSAAAHLVRTYEEIGTAPPGFGHRLHTQDPRTARLFQMALELDLDGQHQQMIRAIDRSLRERHIDAPALPINVDGAMAAICADLGFDPSIGNALFIISRVPGLVAHAREEAQRESPMRQIEATAGAYDGAPQRRLPDRQR